MGLGEGRVVSFAVKSKPAAALARHYGVARNTVMKALRGGVNVHHPSSVP
jgi:hypothetical protein